MDKKPMKKLNKKAIFDSSENIAAQNVPIAIGAGVYISYWLLVALGLILVAGTIVKLGCSCSCRCASSWNSMAAASGYGNNAVTLARR